MRKVTPFKLPPTILIYNRFVHSNELTRGMFEIKGAFVAGLSGEYLVIKGVGSDGTYVCDNMDLSAFAFYAEGGELNNPAFSRNIGHTRAWNCYWKKE